MPIRAIPGWGSNRAFNAIIEINVFDYINLIVMSTFLDSVFL